MYWYSSFSSVNSALVIIVIVKLLKCKYFKLCNLILIHFSIQELEDLALLVVVNYLTDALSKCSCPPIIFLKYLFYIMPNSPMLSCVRCLPDTIATRPFNATVITLESMISCLLHVSYVRYNCSVVGYQIPKGGQPPVVRG